MGIQIMYNNKSEKVGTVWTIPKNAEFLIFTLTFISLKTVYFIDVSRFIAMSQNHLFPSATSQYVNSHKNNLVLLTPF